MLANLDSLNKHLLDIKYGRVKQGLKIGIPEIDEHLRFKSSQFNLIIGHANVGKTTVILYLMVLYTIKHNIKWLIFSAENSSQSVARKLIEFKTNQPINKLSDQEIKKELKWLNTVFQIIEVDDLYSYKDLLTEATLIKSQFKYDGLLIDPYNSLVKDKALLKGINSHEYDYQVATEFRLFCKHQKVSIWLNAHAVTEALRKTHAKDHEMQGLPMPPSLADVEGGGKWGNRADDVFTIHRYIQHPTDWMFSEIHVRKIKEVETGGRPTSLNEPIKLRMKVNNVGFEYAGTDLLDTEKRDINELLNF